MAATRTSIVALLLLMATLELSEGTRGSRPMANVAQTREVQEVERNNTGQPGVCTCQPTCSVDDAITGRIENLEEATVQIFQLTREIAANLSALTTLLKQNSSTDDLDDELGYQGDCDPPFTRIPNYPACVVYERMQVSFEDAEEICPGRYGSNTRLLTMETERKFLAVQNFMLNYYERQWAWVGGKKVGDAWYWVSGKLLTYQNHWKAGHPGCTPLQDYMLIFCMQGTCELHAWYNRHVRRFLCEKY